VFAECGGSVLSQHYQRVIRLRAIHRIAFLASSAERRVREAICAGGLVRDRRYEQVLTGRGRDRVLCSAW
jgi:hypothetical protein